jgi:hypothetical protein
MLVSRFKRLRPPSFSEFCGGFVLTSKNVVLYDNVGSSYRNRWLCVKQA